MKSERGFTLVEIMIVVAIIGLLAAIAIPNFKRSMATARQTACELNRKQIEGAKLQWALDHRQPPDAIPGEDDLFGANAYIEHKPECPARGVYTLNCANERCTCSVHLPACSP